MKFIAYIALLMMPTLAMANRTFVPLSTVIRNSPLVVYGEITDIKYAPKQRHAYDVAIITVSEVLKNNTTERIAIGTKIHLSLPSRNNEKKLSTESSYSYDRGLKGFWLLEFKDDAFWAKGLQHYQSPEQREAISNALAQTVESAHSTAQKNDN